LYNILSSSYKQADYPIFTMPWVLTWLSHEMRDPEIIGRAFDFFICSHPISPIYSAVSVITSKKKQIMDLNSWEITDIFPIFQRINFTIEDLELIFENAKISIEKYEPASIIGKVYDKLQNEYN